MMTASMCSSSIFQAVPRSRIHSLTNIWCKRISTSSRNGVDGYTWIVLASRSCNPEEGGSGPRRRWIRRRPITTTTSEGGKKKSTLSSSSSSSSSSIPNITSLGISAKTEKITQFQQIQQHSDLHGQIPDRDKDDLASHVTTFFSIDIETTGFNRDGARIIEIAIRDLQGGRNSTFQTLINPECQVPNAHVHGITTRMVNRPEVPRMKELIPILIRYIRSRQKPQGYVVLIAHNGRTFDVPFLTREFRRCAYEIPPDWLFLDTLPLAREAMKNGNGGSKLSSKVSLQALREHYGIPLVGRAHRAMSDANLLALVFQRLTFDLKLPTSTIIGRCFKASDLM
ncbi:hypothetical protein Dimus_021670 [Dionaea muscipula]